MGSGDTVLRQSPASGSVSKGGTVVLYTDDTPEEMKTVPSLTGLTREQAMSVIEENGLNLSVKGNDADAKDAVAQADQS